ncbi:MAG: alpha-1,4-glucan--maltose-1-phosphate maltosyltransferase, partial [Acidimicrobiales bacterium]
MRPADSRSASGANGAEAARPLPSVLRRVVIDGIRPQVDGGKYPAKAVIGGVVDVSATVFADGHDLVAGDLQYRHSSERSWSTTTLSGVGADRFGGGFPVAQLGRYQFFLRADVDRWRTWRRDALVRAAAGRNLSIELEVGASLVMAGAGRARPSNRVLLESVAREMRAARRGLESDVTGDVALDHGGTVAGLISDEGLADLLWSCRDPEGTETSDRLEVVVEPERALFGTWYELFPRSLTTEGRDHGTLSDVLDHLDYVSRLGADVLYLPPIHPIGVTSRKGRNGTERAVPGDPGSPWAIGGAEGGHKAIHPQLGTLADFDALVETAARRGIDVALDLAFQCSPDHPWVREHPDWFRRLPDGSIRYAENPPKHYEDIYPLDFETDDWRALWNALLDVVRFWVAHGVRVFRVDNPHTKPFALWEWLIATVKTEHPEVIFLAEAFTRPDTMKHLAKLGFSQSYTYFTWRNTKWELETYLTELTRSPMVDYFRPNFWPNTPDILPEPLHRGGTPSFLARLVLAATLSASYGIYGPAFELQEHDRRDSVSEEYEHSEKYALRRWDLEGRDSLADFVARINRIRHEHPALHHNTTLRF